MRKGTTLIEMLVVITTMTIVMGVAVATISSVLHMNTAAQEQTLLTATLGRLAAQFRSDLHAATDASAAADHSALTLELPAGRHVVYRAAPGRVVRTEETKPATPREDVFRLPVQASAILEIEPAAEKTAEKIAVLRLRTPGLVGPMLKIDAALARDHRFEKPVEAKR